jgi:hypothetical protein
MEGMERWSPTAGTLQGAVISPLFANIYLRRFRGPGRAVAADRVPASCVIFVALTLLCPSKNIQFCLANRR